MIYPEDNSDFDGVGRRDAEGPVETSTFAALPIEELLDAGRLPAAGVVAERYLPLHQAS